MRHQQKSLSYARQASIFFRQSLCSFIKIKIGVLCCQESCRVAKRTKIPGVAKRKNRVKDEAQQNQSD